jgi:hypothetical protein
MTRPGELDIDRQLREANERAARAYLARVEAEKDNLRLIDEIARLQGIIAEMVKIAEKVKAEA